MTTIADSGLAALVSLLRFNGIGADPEQIRHRFGGASIGVSEMLLSAKEFGLKARPCKTSWARLSRMPLPTLLNFFCLRPGNPLP